MSILVQDNFDRANSTTVIGSPQIGPAPTIIQGVGGISSNQMYASTTILHAYWECGATNVDISLDYTISLTSGRGVGIVIAGASVTDHYLVQIEGSGNGLAMFWGNPGGTYPVVARYAIQSPPTTGTLRVTYYDGMIAAYLDGVRRFRHETLKPLTSTRHGLRVPHNSARIDNLLIQDADPIPLDSVGDTPNVGFSSIATDSATAQNVFLYRGRDTKAQDLLGGF